MKKESQICIIDSPDRNLQTYEKMDDITYVTKEEEIFQFFGKLLPVFKQRNQLKQQMIAEDCEEDEIFERMSKEIPYFIFISDLSWFVPFIYNAEMDMRGFLENITAKGRLHNIYFISDLSLEKREQATGYAIYETFAGYKTGIHLGGKVSDNMVLSFDYLSFMEQNKGEKTGIGQIPDAGDEKDTKKVVIPLARR
jgi:S-DNA-T family DNA segregation ATPase FtsK/SpoIIIE